MNWTDYFRREDALDRAFRRTLPPDRARLLARELACRPMSVDCAIRLLRQVGTPGRNDPAIVKAHELLMRLEPDAAPPLDAIRIAALPGHEGECVKGVIFISEASTLYRAAQNGDALPLAMLLAHEQWHADHPGAPEEDARRASLRFCERHNLDPLRVGLNKESQT